MNTLELKELTKSYDKKKALDSFSFVFKPGIYGLLGANGAGKSTMMNLITDNVKRDKGAILYEEKEILKLGDQYRKILGYMPQQQGMYDKLSASAFLLYIASLKGLKKKEAKQQIGRAHV